MSATAALLNALETEIDTLITHVGLVDETGTELTGGDPAYARQAVTWEDDGDGVIRPDASLDFDIPEDTTVAGWRGYSASAAGTDYGGEDLSPETFISQGSYRLLASQTAIRIA
jgi:hypothetical protein